MYSKKTNHNSLFHVFSGGFIPITEPTDGGGDGGGQQWPTPEQVASGKLLHSFNDHNNT